MAQDCKPSSILQMSPPCPESCPDPIKAALTVASILPFVVPQNLYVKTFQRQTPYLKLTKVFPRARYGCDLVQQPRGSSRRGAVASVHRRRVRPRLPAFGSGSFSLTLIIHHASTPSRRPSAASRPVPSSLTTMTNAPSAPTTRLRARSLAGHPRFSRLPRLSPRTARLRVLSNSPPH
ncbi:hypothetical protein FB451DRAFT_1279843 [Mycena latifolia]|nr:hypothetical protein FB451DRAFT_1279843 [Mycena latifolia]